LILASWPRVRALLRRDMRVREPLLQLVDLKLDPAARVAWQANRRLALTRKEFGILEYLMRRPGEVVSQEQLLEHVWDAEANPFTNTVRVHINSLRRKLGDTAETPRYIETVVGALLFIDDAPDINSLLVNYFRQAGFDTLGAHDGRTGLDMARAEHPDLIVLDLGLPDIDGIDVCRELRRASAVPIVMLTRRGELGDRVKGLEAGADYYLVKPFRIEELKAVIDAMLRRSAPPTA
jgi:DNA-binding response OmpR family regulator